MLLKSKFFLPRYLQKYVKKKANFIDGALYIPPSVKLPDRVNKRFAAHYHYDKEGKVPMYILMSKPSPFKLYQVYLFFRNLFLEEMVRTMSDSHQSGLTAKSGLETFLLYFDITAAEYSFDRGYKNWQRHNYRQLIKA